MHKLIYQTGSFFLIKTILNDVHEKLNKEILEPSQSLVSANCSLALVDLYTAIHFYRVLLISRLFSRTYCETYNIRYSWCFLISYYLKNTF